MEHLLSDRAIQMQMPAYSWRLPDGVTVSTLTTHADSRGDLTEIFRSEWRLGREPVQWNFVNSVAHVLRGVHVHHRHTDYLFLCKGSMHLGLCDVRKNSPTYGARFLLHLTESTLKTIVIPTGVAHGFYFPEVSMLIYAVSDYWSLDDELGCKWDDPELNLPWDIQNPLLSPRDTAAVSFREMCQHYDAICSSEQSSPV